jgi:hypothetical protein
MPLQSLDLADRGPGVDAAQEADLGLVDVAGAGDGRAGRAGRCRWRRPGRRGGGPRPRPGPSRGRGRRGRGGRRPRARRRSAAVRRWPGGIPTATQGSVRSTARTWKSGAAPALPRAVQVPGALHLEVGVQSGPRRRCAAAGACRGARRPRGPSGPLRSAVAKPARGSRWRPGAGRPGRCACGWRPARTVSPSGIGSPSPGASPRSRRPRAVGRNPASVRARARGLSNTVLAVGLLDRQPAEGAGRGRPGRGRRGRPGQPVGVVGEV